MWSVTTNTFTSSFVSGWLASWEWTTDLRMTRVSRWNIIKILMIISLKENVLKWTWCTSAWSSVAFISSSTFTNIVALARFWVAACISVASVIVTRFCKIRIVIGLLIGQVFSRNSPEKNIQISIFILNLLKYASMLWTSSCTLCILFIWHPCLTHLFAAYLLLYRAILVCDIITITVFCLDFQQVSAGCAIFAIRKCFQG